jgi:hypothetical protein
MNDRTTERQMKALNAEIEKQFCKEERYIIDITNGIDVIASSFKPNLDYINRQFADESLNTDELYDSTNRLGDADRKDSIESLKTLIEIDQPKLIAAKTAKEKAMDSGNVDEISAAVNALKEINDRISFYQGQLERIERE